MTQNETIKRIRKELGEPTIKVELTDEQIGFNIDKSLSFHEEELDEDNLERIIEYAVALSKKQWGFILGKYYGTSSAKVNYEFIYVSGCEELNRLREKY